MRLDASTFLVSSGKRVLEPRGGLSTITESTDLEVIRRQQREEIVSTIRQEEILEKQRIMILSDTTRTPGDLERLHAKFALERRDA